MTHYRHFHPVYDTSSSSSESETTIEIRTHPHHEHHAAVPSGPVFIENKNEIIPAHHHHHTGVTKSHHEAHGKSHKHIETRTSGRTNSVSSHRGLHAAELAAGILVADEIRAHYGPDPPDHGKIRHVAEAIVVGAVAKAALDAHEKDKKLRGPAREPRTYPATARKLAKGALVAGGAIVAGELVKETLGRKKSLKAVGSRSETDITESDSYTSDDEVRYGHGKHSTSPHHSALDNVKQIAYDTGRTVADLLQDEHGHHHRPHVHA